ncbi:SpoIIE family protein phosphatase [candidate division KSB1 bacterium]|nr:SpoIIE family protein phosphatase [candidate division KSB1 bacterium]MBL7093177.1 SpoIIE family protein phosphatase [candidate division KSB1 bacterium]
MPSILLVDDDKNILFLISEALKKFKYDLTLATGGEKALEILQENEFDLIISDLQMPKVSGIDILSVVKEKYTDTEVLLVTGYGSIKTAVKAMKLGAFEYLSKPVNVEELRHKVTQALQRKELKIKLAKQQKALDKYHEMIQRDLKLAEQIHQSLVPQIYKNEKIEIGVKYLPMIGLGGDFADIYYDGEKYIYLTLIDVTGHGISAALLVNRICSEVRKLVRENLQPAQILYDLNNFIMDVFDQTGMFLTTFTTRINTDNYEFSYAGSAHPALVLWKNEKNRFEKLSSQNVIIGFERKDANEFIQETVQLKSGDKLFLYTDGIVEAENENKKALGIIGFINILNRLKSFPANEIVERIIDNLQQQYYTQVRDDIFLIAVDFN